MKNNEFHCGIVNQTIGFDPQNECGRKLWLTITKSITIVSKLQTRDMFLQKCQNFKFIPPNMVVKPMQNSNPSLYSKYTNVTKNASFSNLRIALLDAKRSTVEAKKNHTHLLWSI